ncbi:MAG: hypothetical protein ACRDT6_16375 [Micromonosporaceae bacterium]
MAAVVKVKDRQLTGNSDIWQPCRPARDNEPQRLEEMSDFWIRTGLPDWQRNKPAVPKQRILRYFPPIDTNGVSAVVNMTTRN